MRPFATLIYEKDGPVARISLDRPAALNAYNVQMRDDMAEALDAAAADPDVRALLLTGEGRAFCAGADLTEFGTAPSQVIARRVRWQRDVWGRMVNWDKPMVAAVHGHCIGSGVEMALLCDLRLAAEDAVFAMPETRLGMIPAAGGSQTLPRNVGLPRALELLLTGRRFTAAEALAMGLVTRLTSPEGLRDAAGRVAAALAAAPPTTMAALKRALREGADLPLAAGLELESRIAARLASQRPAGVI